ncbi:LysR family transcriptional regulator [Rhizobium sp. LC145]|jgi:DNA-binding transcriptional LysR family regulator|uniref:LysR family transcriptional regulator n=1 Tax=Rhizobium sp. LC145 TaxID=1120688 RepID=UPI000629F29E|nr:LysR family transcriptional regulator [Rhizobium sp. LC145]KKX27160.1 LysR family transcriptional regulator [Rhizobium sp. LC145]TKT57690.1 LysR family transcriptional regulator [Rhizobiaceae bacterium LC148]
MLNHIDLSRTDLNLLVLFEAVMEERHVGRSAQRLNLSPSAVSHGLRRLRALLCDPLFIRTPRGVVPTDRALELAGPVAEVLERARQIIISSEAFDPQRSSRRFTIGAPDGASSVLLHPLLQKLASNAPGVSLGVRQLLPRPGETSMASAWGDALIDLERRAIDIAIIPHDNIPARFQHELLYEEDFVVAMRAGHPLKSGTTLASYCEMKHLVVSHSADPFGFVDAVLAQQGLTREVALTVPNFMLALAVLADSELVGALPRHFVQMFETKFGIEHVDAPIDLGRFKMNLVVPKAALMDTGIAWLVNTIRTMRSADLP